MVDNRRTRYNSSRQSNGCSSNNCSSNNCSSLKKRLKAVEFSIIDTALYLDVYPTCRKALSHYNKLIKEREMLLESMNGKCGPMTIYDNASCDEWNWTTGPWPWESDAR